MKELVILSGKGGTGKTSLTASFAVLAGKAVLCDADVDAADLHLLLGPERQSSHDFMGGNLAYINREGCTACGTCRELCHFDAISKEYTIDPIACEGCGVCVALCPQQTIAFPQQKSGEYYLSTCRTGPMVHAKLGIAEENSGKLVSVIRQEARRIAEKESYDLIITDGPPGIGCPVISSLSGAEKAVLVVEPTLSGKHDVERVVKLTSHFRIPTMLCVNRFDINIEVTEEIEALARENGVTILPRVPFDPTFVHAMIAGKTIVEYDEAAPAAQRVREVWQQVLAHGISQETKKISLRNYS